MQNFRSKTEILDKAQRTSAGPILEDVGSWHGRIALLQLEATLDLRDLLDRKRGRVEEKWNDSCKNCRGEVWVVEYTENDAVSAMSSPLRPTRVPCPACSVTPNTTEV